MGLGCKGEGVGEAERRGWCVWGRVGGVEGVEVIFGGGAGGVSW